MSLTKPPKDRMIRPGDAENKMADEKKTLPDGRVQVKVLKGFMYNGSMVNPDDVIEMNLERAVNHMRVGDVERQEDLIEKVKASRVAAAEAAKADAEGEW